MPKHFKKGVKKEHHFLRGIERLLEKIAGIEGVEKVIPGRIYSSYSGGFEIKVSRETRTGLKLIAKSYGSVQEVFIVVEESNKDSVRREIEDLTREKGWKQPDR